MSTVIYYFSGTGNSLFMAKGLAEELDESACVDSVMQHFSQKKITVEADTVGFVFPVYFMSVPKIIQKFIKKQEFKNDPYIFAVATCNGGLGHTLYTVGRLLKKKGNRLDAGFVVNMPGNSLIIRDFMNPPEVQKERLRLANERIPEIAAYIRERKTGAIGGSDGLKAHIQGLLFSSIATYLYNTPKKFKTTALCTKCKTCCAICPKKNIRMGANGPEWGGDCEQCLACFHWCPQAAIEIGNYTAGKPRYHHPDVQLKEMADAGR